MSASGSNERPPADHASTSSPSEDSLGSPTVSRKRGLCPSSQASNRSNVDPIMIDQEYDEYGFEWPESGPLPPKDVSVWQNFKNARTDSKWRSFLSEDPKMQNPHRLKKLCRLGVPHKLRPLVWVHCLGITNIHKKKPGEFERLANQPVKEASGNVIDLDITRTFPKHKLFKTTDGQQRLRKVLRAYAARNENLGYCQSMNFIAAMLMIIIKDDELAFWALVTLIEDPRYAFAEFYMPGMAGLRRDMNVVDQLLQKFELKMIQRLKQAGIDVTWVCSQWFLALYCTSLPTSATLRVWDCLFSEGWKIVFRVAVSLCKLQSRGIVNCQNNEALLELCATRKWIHENVDVNTMLSSGFKVVLRRNNLRELRVWGLEQVKFEDEKAAQRRQAAEEARARKLAEQENTMQSEETVTSTASASNVDPLIHNTAVVRSNSALGRMLSKSSFGKKRSGSFPLSDSSKSLRERFARGLSGSSLASKEGLQNEGGSQFFSTEGRHMGPRADSGHVAQKTAPLAPTIERTDASGSSDVAGVGYPKATGGRRPGPIPQRHKAGSAATTPGQGGLQALQPKRDASADRNQDMEPTNS